MSASLEASKPLPESPSMGASDLGAMVAEGLPSTCATPALRAERRPESEGKPEANRPSERWLLGKSMALSGRALALCFPADGTERMSILSSTAQDVRELRRTRLPAERGRHWPLRDTLPSKSLSLSCGKGNTTATQPQPEGVAA